MFSACLFEVNKPIWRQDKSREFQKKSILSVGKIKKTIFSDHFFHICNTTNMSSPKGIRTSRPLNEDVNAIIGNDNCSSSRTVSFEHLNEYCMIAIMRWLHVVDRIPLRLVSRRWQTIIDGTFRVQHSLKIFDDYFTMLDCYRAFTRCDSFLEQNYLSKFKLDEIFPRTSESPSNGDRGDFARSTERKDLSVLLRLFPNIDRLIVGLGSSQNIDLASLLRSFPQLESLTLIGQSKSSGSISASATQAINEMHLLRHIKFFCFDLSPNSVAILSRLTIFEQLESLEISNCYTASIDQKFDFVTPLLERLNRQRFRRLALNQFILDEEQLVAIFDKNRDLLQNVTHLALNVRLREEQLEKLDDVHVNFYSNEKMIYTVMTERVAKLVLDYFPALTSLQCTLPELLFGETSIRLLDHLRAIPNLTDLAVFLVKNLLFSSSSPLPPIHHDLFSIRRLRIIVPKIGTPSQSSPISLRLICLFEQCFPSLTEISIFSIEEIASNTIEHWQRDILPLRVTNFAVKSFCDAYKLPFSSAAAVAADSCAKIGQKVISIHHRAVFRNSWLQKRYDFINREIPITRETFELPSDFLSNLNRFKFTLNKFK